jgi:hypothetical protein
MLKHIGLIVVLAWQLDPSYVVEDHRGGPAKLHVRRRLCRLGLAVRSSTPVPEGVASIVGGDYDAIRGITVILDQTFYTAVFDAPLKSDDKFPTLRQGFQFSFCRARLSRSTNS